MNTFGIKCAMGDPISDVSNVLEPFLCVFDHIMQMMQVIPFTSFRFIKV